MLVSFQALDFHFLLKVYKTFFLKTADNRNNTVKTIHDIKESFSRLAVSKFQSKRRGMHRDIKMNVLLSRQEPKSSYSFCIVLTQRMYTSGTWLEAHPEFCKNYLKPYKKKWHSLVFLSGRSQNPLFAWLQQISSNCRHWSRYSETWRGSSRDDRKVRHFSTLAHLKHAEASYCQNFFLSSLKKKCQLQEPERYVRFQWCLYVKLEREVSKKPYNYKYFKYMILISFPTIFGLILAI